MNQLTALDIVRAQHSVNGPALALFSLAVGLLMLGQHILAQFESIHIIEKNYEQELIFYKKIACPIKSVDKIIIYM